MMKRILFHLGLCIVALLQLSCKSANHTAELAEANSSNATQNLKTAQYMFVNASTTSPNNKLEQNLLRAAWYCKDVTEMSRGTESIYKFSKSNNGSGYNRTNQKMNEVVPLLAPTKGIISGTTTWAIFTEGQDYSYLYSANDIMPAYNERKVVAFRDEYAFHGPTQQVLVERVVSKGQGKTGIKPSYSNQDFNLTDLGTYFICSTQSNGQKVTYN